MPTDRNPPSGVAQGGVAALALVLSGVYQLIGAQLTMDDWWTLRNARFEGAWQSAGADQWLARPGAGVVYAFVFGGIGAHPAVYVLVLAALNALSAVLFMRITARFLGARVALVAAVVWVIVPNHLALEVWGSSTNIVVSQVLGLLGVLLLSRAPVRGWRLVVALVCFSAGSLCYEALVPIAGLSVVVVPWLVRRRFDLVASAAGLVVVGATGLWQLVHVNPAKKIGGFTGDPFVVLPANLGWGVTSLGVLSDVLLVVAMVGSVVALARLVAPSLRSSVGDGEWAVLAGLVVMFVGTLAYIRYGFEPVGGGDRANYLAAFGGALVWAGLADMVIRVRVPTPALVALAVGFVALVVPTRWERWQLWHDAGTDGVAIAKGVVDAYPVPPATTIVVGPRIVHGNLTAFFEDTMLEAAVQLNYGRDDVHVKLATTPEALAAAPPDARYDIRPVSRLPVVEATDP